MKVAICDDDVYISGKVEKLLEEAFEGNAFNFTCNIYSSGESLLSFLKENQTEFQIYVLDIEMSGINGLDTAKEIRKVDSDAIIIFLTSHDELMGEAFQVLAFEYLLKPLDDNKTKKTFLSAINHIEKRQKVFQFNINRRKYSVYVNQIEYLESVGRKVLIHTTEGKVEEYYGTLKDALTKVPSLSFSQVHNSFILNMEHTSIIESAHVTMKNGDLIPVGQKYHSQFHKRYRKYVLSQMGF